jgi:hypothetical protein
MPPSKKDGKPPAVTHPGAFLRLSHPGLLPRVPGFQKQSVFNLSGCRFDAAAALGSEDHQLGGVLPRAALLNMLGLIQNQSPHVRECGETGVIL